MAGGLGRAELVATGGDRETDVRFIGLRSGPGFEISDDSDAVFADLGAAFKIALGERATMEANVDSLLADSERTLTAGARLNILF